MAPDNRLIPYTTSVVGLLRQHADEVAQVRQRPVGSSGYDRTLASYFRRAEDSHPDPCNRARHYYCDARRFQQLPSPKTKKVRLNP